MNTNTKQTIINLLKEKHLSVEKLQQAGFRSFITHWRYHKISHDVLEMEPQYIIDEKGHRGEICAKGGKTYVELEEKNSGISAFGEAECSLQDPYVKNTGINYAIRRALRNMISSLPKETQ